MAKIGLDIGTGFVKCVSDCCQFKFPSLYVKRTGGEWTNKVFEAVGESALRMLKTRGAAGTGPICKGRPDARYTRQAQLLIQESLDRVRQAAGRAGDSQKARIVVGLPYEASDQKGVISRMVRKSDWVEQCDVVAQAVGTLVDLGMDTGIAVSVGQGTAEIVVVEDDEVIDGQSSVWASEFITGRMGRFAHLDMGELIRRKETCTKYAKVMTENLAQEVSEMAKSYGNTHELALSGGGILIPGVRDGLVSKLKDFKIHIPSDPVMSNACGLYKLIA